MKNRWLLCLLYCLTLNSMATTIMAGNVENNAHYEDFYIDDKQYINNVAINHDNSFIILDNGSHMKILDKNSKALRWYIDKNYIQDTGNFLMRKQLIGQDKWHKVHRIIQ